MVKYVFVTKKGTVIVKDIKTKNQAYAFMEKHPSEMEIWGSSPKQVMEWLAKHKPNWLTNALVRMNGKNIKG